MREFGDWIFHWADGSIKPLGGEHMDDWIAHDGTCNPVRREERLISYRTRRGKPVMPVFDDGTMLRWTHDGGDLDIVAYRVDPPRTTLAATLGGCADAGRTASLDPLSDLAAVIAAVEARNRAEFLDALANPLKAGLDTEIERLGAMTKKLLDEINETLVKRDALRAAREVLG